MTDKELPKPHKLEEAHIEGFRELIEEIREIDATLQTVIRIHAHERGSIRLKQEEFLNGVLTDLTEFHGRLVDIEEIDGEPHLAALKEPESEK